jgi:hypothetical protein
VNRKLIFLNVVLLALAGWLCWTLRMKWLEAHRHEHAVIAAAAPKKVVFPPTLSPLTKPFASSEYNDVAQHELFSKDRNPNVIVDPPPPPPPTPPPPPMPELPAYYGTMALFGDPVVLLSLPKGPQKKYHAGDKVGPFQLVSFDREKVVFDWNGKTVERRPDELKEKEPSQQQQQVAEGPAERVAPVKLIPDPPPDSPKISEKIGADNGGGIRMCVAGDTTPVGTIIDGYKKVITTNMFGQTCMWQAVNP